MTIRLVGTVVPNIGHEAYEVAIATATALELATAAFASGYCGDFGDDYEAAETIVELVGDLNPDVIEMLAAHDEAIEALRAAARNAAQWIADNSEHPHLYPASLMGGPDVLMIASMSDGADPFDEFEDVALLAALLGAPSRPHPQQTQAI